MTTITFEFTDNEWEAIQAKNEESNKDPETRVTTEVFFRSYMTNKVDQWNAAKILADRALALNKLVEKYTVEELQALADQ